MNLPVISIEPYPCSVERYVLKNEDGLTWGGDSFKDSTPQLFANINQAATEVINILKKNFEGVERKRFVVPLFVDVYSQETVSVSEVLDHVSKNVQLHTNPCQHGPNGSLVTVTIEWNQIESMRGKHVC